MERMERMESSLTTAEEFRMEARELDLIAFNENSGWLSRAAKVIEQAADRIEQLEKGQ